MDTPELTDEDRELVNAIYDVRCRADSSLSGCWQGIADGFLAGKRAAQTRELPRELTIAQMLTMDGMYVVGDKARAGWLVPVAVLNGKAYAWAREHNPLRRSRWHPTAFVVAGPIHYGTITELESAKEQGK